jgi:hypothetical protein
MSVVILTVSGFEIILRRTTLGRTPLDQSLVHRKDLYLSTQYSQETDIRVPDGIRTYNLSKRAAAFSRLRTSNHWGWHIYVIS